ncbi:MAG: AAA family ATPase [Bacilli bacterium]|nr:AAA family ATPase [Bacilli bacterium]
MNGKSVLTDEELKKAFEVVTNLRKYYQARIVGQESLCMSLIISMMTNSHLLIESVPGLAKTTAARVVTDAVNGKFSRIQCTPDLLPSDIIGGQIFNYANSSFDTKLGPVFANFVLLDEINRSSAKTQSAMLEAMQERSVTIGGRTYNLEDVFVVIATQNPIEQEGTYTLAEAQVDRFLLKEKLVYPTIEEEVLVLNRLESNALANNNPIYNLDAVLYLQAITKKVYIDESIKKYIATIIDATRYPKNYIDPRIADFVVMGASPRGSIAFMEASKACAIINGRSYVTPDDIKMVANRVLRHRIMLSFQALANNIEPEFIIDAIMKVVPTP